MKRLSVGTALGLMVAVPLLTMTGQDSATTLSAGQHTAVASFAGGCFWCVEAGFEQVPGVLEAISGYTGGDIRNPTYEQVASGSTGHVESVEVHYDSDVINYDGLLEAFWRMIDPTDAGGQFADRGFEYTTAIYYHDEDQRRRAESSRAGLAASGRYGKPVVTRIEPASEFYRAEDRHQDYYMKNPLRYTFYRFLSGRDRYLDEIWGEDIHVDYSKYSPAVATGFHKPSEEQLRGTLTSLQYNVTQEEGTEPPFDNAYWDDKREGIYVDVVSGEPLFSSGDKFDSGTGWPSFTRPLDKQLIVEEQDYRLLVPRTEVRSRFAGSHLGHVFTDGPAPTGLRYCINSAALRFIPRDQLDMEGYSRYRALFE